MYSTWNIIIIIIIIVLLNAGLIQSSAKSFTWGLRQMKGGMSHYFRGKYLLVIIILEIAVCLLTLRAVFIICEQYLWVLFSAIPVVMVSFFIMPRAPITTGTVLVLNFQIFITSISRSLSLENFWNYSREIFSSAETATSIMMHVFFSKFFIVISGLFLSTCIDSKVPLNC